MIAIDISSADTKSSVLSAYASYGVPAEPMVLYSQGASALAALFGSSNSGGPTWIMHPKHTFSVSSHNEPSLSSTITAALADDCPKGVTVAQFALTVTSPNGTVVKSPDAATYDSATVVQLTATPSAGYVFAGWSGDATGSSNPVSVTMNAAKSVTATFNAIQIDTTNPSGNLVELAGWDVSSDGASTAALDTTGIVGGNGVKGTFAIGSADSNWAELANYFDIDLGGATYVKVVYKASKANVMTIVDPALADLGEGYGVNLPIATSWSTLLFKLDNKVFAQPTGSTAATLDLSKVFGISFSPGSLDYNVSPAGSSTVEVKELVVYGKGSLMNPVAIREAPLTARVSNLLHTGSMLKISGINGSVEMYSVSGRLVRSISVKGTASIDLSGLSAGTYMVSMKNAGRISSDKVVIGR